MYSLDHYEWRKPRMHYGWVGTRAHARRPYRDAEGEWVLPMFPDPEEQYREFPFGYPHEQLVGRKYLMPHFQRMAMEQRELQGNATFQLAPDGDLPRKRGRPCKTPSATGEPPRVFTGECQCRELAENAQGGRSVAGYTEDFVNRAKMCKPKSAEMWCKWYKQGLRKDIRDQLRGVLEPLEFALVRRVAGFAMEAEERIESNREMNDCDLRSPSGEPPKKKRERTQKPDGAPGGCDCEVLVQMVQKPRTVRDYLEEFMHTAKMCLMKPAEEWCRLFKMGLRKDIQDELVGVLEPLEFALVKRMAGQAILAEERVAERKAAEEGDAEDDRYMEEDGPLEGASEGVRATDCAARDDGGPTRGGGWLSE